MVAQASLDNLKSVQTSDNITPLDREKSQMVRRNPVLQMVEAQNVLHKIITGSVRWFNGEEVVDVPAREIASCSVALCKLEERIRLNRGLGNPAPVKVEPKGQRRGRQSSRVITIEPDAEPAVVPPATQP